MRTVSTLPSFDPRTVSIVDIVVVGAIRILIVVARQITVGVVVPRGGIAQAVVGVVAVTAVNVI